jgi:hypothetical protein
VLFIAWELTHVTADITEARRYWNSLVAKGKTSLERNTAFICITAII